MGGGGTRPYGPYRCSDGRWLAIGFAKPHWAAACQVMGAPELIDDPRFDTFIRRMGENAPALIEILDEVFATAPAHEWAERLNGIGLFASVVQDYREVAEDPQVLANGYIQEVAREHGDAVRLAGSGIGIDGEPVRIRGLAPGHGEHTEEVLTEAGYSWEEIAELSRSGVVGPAHRRE